MSDSRKAVLAWNLLLSAQPNVIQLTGKITRQLYIIALNFEIYSLTKLGSNMPWKIMHEVLKRAALCYTGARINK